MSGPVLVDCQHSFGWCSGRGEHQPCRDATMARLARISVRRKPVPRKSRRTHAG